MDEPPCHVCNHTKGWHNPDNGWRCHAYKGLDLEYDCDCPGYTVAVYGVSGHTHQRPAGTPARGDESSGHV